MEPKPNIFEYFAHHGIKGQKWGVRRGPPYPLGEKPSIDEVLAKSQSRSTIVQDALDSGEVSKEINREKQMRHTLSGHIPGRSYIHGGLYFAQSLVDEYCGTGDLIVKKGAWQHKERISAREVIGTHVDSETGEETETRSAIIVYSKTGSHIYPGKDEKS